MMLGRRGWSGKIVIIMIMSEVDDDDDDDDHHHHFHIWPRWERGKREGRKKVSLLFLVFSIIQSVLGLYSMTKTIPLNDFPSSHHTIWYYTHITRDASPAPPRGLKAPPRASLHITLYVVHLFSRTSPCGGCFTPIAAHIIPTSYLSVLLSHVLRMWK